MNEVTEVVNNSPEKKAEELEKRILDYNYKTSQVMGYSLREHAFIEL